jgi:hypothetical protein
VSEKKADTLFAPDERRNPKCPVSGDEGKLNRSLKCFPRPALRADVSRKREK